MDMNQYEHQICHRLMFHILDIWIEKVIVDLSESFANIMSVLIFSLKITSILLYFPANSSKVNIEENGSKHSIDFQILNFSQHLTSEF